MNIDKAIEILSGCKFGSRWPQRKSELDAIKLGIEALKAIKCGREGLRTEFETPLIGETKG